MDLDRKDRRKKDWRKLSGVELSRTSGPEAGGEASSL